MGALAAGRLLRLWLVGRNAGLLWRGLGKLEGRNGGVTGARNAGLLPERSTLLVGGFEVGLRGARKAGLLGPGLGKLEARKGGFKDFGSGMDDLLARLCFETRVLSWRVPERINESVA